MYMLFHLTPSVEVTGGVWYTDNEFDTPFVKILLDHIYGYIANRVSLILMRGYSCVLSNFFTDAPFSNLIMRTAIASTI
jgi:hypothetical protein